MVAAALYNAEKAALRPLTDDEQLAVLTREVKQRRESVEAYTKAGRLDLAEREQAEADLIRDVHAHAPRRGAAGRARRGGHRRDGRVVRA